MAKIQKVKPEVKSAIQRKSAYSLPNNPSDAGYKADDIRRAFYKPIIDITNSALSEIDRVIDEINKVYGFLTENIDMISEVTGNVYSGADGLTYSFEDNKFSITGYNGQAEELRLPDMVLYQNIRYPVVAIKEEAFSGKEIKSVEIASSITEIGDKAFNGCNLLTAVKFDGNATLGTEVFTEGKIDFSVSKEYLTAYETSLASYKKSLTGYDTVASNAKTLAERKINGKPLSDDVTLSAEDVGAYKKGQTYSREEISQIYDGVALGYVENAGKASNYTEGGGIAKAIKDIQDKFDDIEKSKIYGVDGINKSSLTRTGSSIGFGYSRDGYEIQSDFDNCYPWSGIHDVTDEKGNVFVYIPKFYSRVDSNSDGTYKLQISGKRHAGFTTLFIDGAGNELDYVLVGKYEGSVGDNGKICSKTNQTVAVNLTIASYRTKCESNGAGYQQYDLLIDGIIKHLFTVEFATTNSASIMNGFRSGSAALVTGHTDPVSTPSGSYNKNSSSNSSANGSNTAACKYRGIENPWGNVEKYCDGINFNDAKRYFCHTPSSYVSFQYDTPYIEAGTRVIGSHAVQRVSTLSHYNLHKSYGLLFWDDNDTALDDKAFGSAWYSLSTSGKVALTLGGYYSTSYSGLWYYGGKAITNGYSSVGGRLCYKPINTEA